MNATAAALDFARPFREECDSLASTSEAALRIRDGTQNVLEVKRILKRAGLTMVDVSARTRMRFGEKTPYFVPQTFLYKQKAGITPHICQVAALSEVTGFRFSDWLSLCGFDFRLILVLQLRIPNERTTVLTPFRYRFSRELFCAQDDPAGGELHDRYFYAKIGRRDPVAEPDVRPGSIVRVDRSYSPQLLKEPGTNRRLWLVEHPAGITCCCVKPAGSGQVILSPNRPPLSPWPLRLSTEARILGLVDRELQCTEVEKFAAMHMRSKRELFAMSSNLSPRMSFSRLLRISRRRVGLRFREAHELTLRIVEILQNRDFGIAAGLLSDYEAMNKVPRHIAKIISLCVIYGIDPSELLQAAGVHLDDSARRPISHIQESGRACA
jgi:hypothetical protein